jgi:hypothetical protein
VGSANRTNSPRFAGKGFDFGPRFVLLASKLPGIKPRRVRLVMVDGYCRADAAKELTRLCL